ncbi:ral guanine nucleotide dissociation stimulator-like isoform X2 [Pristis pectinata]|uniref:ral guanine nucleotide dissociation stimulator-like isoform X2 n=1 Tax=Pristis pectinata TaxID=685728 RepID=UPI00223D6BFB|nr:ral guanine nucleotide dissociation stimulator-like isoform X2 [Pristis pectinata]
MWIVLGLSGSSPGARVGAGKSVPPAMKTRWYCEFPRSPQCLSEETVDGAVYSVTQKQIQLQQAASKGQQWLGVGNEVVGTTCETVRTRSIKAGRLEKIVQHLLEAIDCGDSSYLSAFLATYRAFTNTQEVLGILLDRLEYLKTETAKTSDCCSVKSWDHFRLIATSVFSTWMEQYSEDFQSLDNACLKRLVRYIRKESRGTELERRAEEILAQNEKLSSSDGQTLPNSNQTEENKRQPTHRSEPTDILTFMADMAAAQLTMMDAELFMKVVPYHCLGSIWSQRDKKGKENLAPTIWATVRQFNKLTNCVISSCLSNTKLRPQQRARILEKWVLVAEECRALKNFSSLYAIISALQSNPVHRLKKTWEEIPREILRRYEDLAEIFSEKNNYSQSRELLIKEGTSKFATPDKKHIKKPKDHKLPNVVQGTVPYLGTFLTDLVMLDTAVKDYVEDGLINFDKRRKEFEIIAQIKLLQKACKNYSFEKEPEFLNWFYGLETLSEAESYKLSCELEPLELASPPSKPRPTLVITPCNDSPPSQNSPTVLSGGLPPWDGPVSPPLEPGCTSDTPGSKEHSLKPINALLCKVAWHPKFPSVSSLDSAGIEPSPACPPSPSALSPAAAFAKGHRRSASCGATYASSSVPVGSPQSDCRIVRVRLDVANGNVYKSILVSSQDKTPAVVGKALEKHNQDPHAAQSYELVQIISEEKEFTIPHNANVFYAMTSASSEFLLRRKDHPSPKPRSEHGSPFPKIRSKGMKIAKALF